MEPGKAGLWGGAKPEVHPLTPPSLPTPTHALLRPSELHSSPAHKPQPYTSCKRRVLKPRSVFSSLLNPVQLIDRHRRSWYTGRRVGRDVRNDFGEKLPFSPCQGEGEPGALNLTAALRLSRRPCLVLRPVVWPCFLLRPIGSRKGSLCPPQDPRRDPLTRLNKYQPNTMDAEDSAKREDRRGETMRRKNRFKRDYGFAQDHKAACSAGSVPQPSSSEQLVSSEVRV